MNASALPHAAAALSAPRGAADEETLKLVQDLKDLACDVLGRGIDRMFDGADDMLFEMARRATNNKDQRIYFDTMRVVRLGRPKIGRIFRDEIAAGFEPESGRKPDNGVPAVSYEDMSLQESKSLEETIAISSMATKAEGIYAQMLFDLGRRIDWMIQEKNAPLDRKAMAPSTISAAFRRSAEALDVEFDVELVIFKLFDRLVISDLGELYTRAMRFLDQSGVKAAAITGAAPRGGMAMGPGGGGQAGSAMNVMSSTTAGYGFSIPPMMDAATLNALRALDSSGGAMAPARSAYYGDAQLGTDLAAAATGNVVHGWDAPRAYAYVQRAGAVGQMFNELMQDPSLPAPLKPRFDQLRFSVIKSALNDSSFFADRQHPVRGLMNELTTMAASARASGMEALRRIEELVGQIQGQFDVAADEVRTQRAIPGAVDVKTMEQFFEQQRDDARQRRQIIIEKTRRIVAEELQLQTLTRKVPEGAWPLLNSGWAPLMALRLLKQGADSEGWRDGMQLLRRILDSVDPRKPASRGAAACDELAEELEYRLRDIGMVDERVHVLLRSWRESLAEVEAATIAGGRSALRVPQAIRVSPRVEPAEDEEIEEIEEIDEIDIESAPPTEAAEDAAETLEDSEPELFGTPELGELVRMAPPAESVENVDPIALMDLLLVLSSWFRVYDHERNQNRWLKVVSHHAVDGTVTFAEFNGQNKLDLRTQVFLDDLVAGRAEAIDLGPAARRSLDAYLKARRSPPEA